jgi:hypothetical protein
MVLAHQHLDKFSGRCGATTFTFFVLEIWPQGDTDTARQLRDMTSRPPVEHHHPLANRAAGWLFLTH